MTHTQTTYTNRIALRADKKGARPAEVGALALVFEKSATELKQKLLKWKNSFNATVGGVGILIGQRALKSLNSQERIQPRMMVATFNGNPRAIIISCYSPTNVSEGNELIAFYE